jgi:hypothetical protein
MLCLEGEHSIKETTPNELSFWENEKVLEKINVLVKMGKICS